jgi:hypothetical protein
VNIIDNFQIWGIIFCIQGVSEIRVLILTSERTRQFMNLFSITFCKIRKSIPRLFAPQFLPNESFCVINYTRNVLDMDCQTQGRLKLMIELYISEICHKFQ